jgi:hypothetical protein
MRTRVALTLVASATWACGGTSPLPTTGSPQDGYSTLLSSSPDPLVSGSFAAATTVTLTVRVGDGLEGTIENLSFVLRDASGGVVAEALVPGPVAIPTGRVERELITPPGAEPGASLLVRGLVRTGDGVIRALELNFAS